MDRDLDLTKLSLLEGCGAHTPLAAGKAGRRFTPTRRRLAAAAADAWIEQRLVARSSKPPRMKPATLSKGRPWVGAREARGVIGNMLEDFRRGVPSEVDYLNGAVVRAAGELGVSAPAHQRMVDLVHELERSGAAPGRERAGDML